MQWSLFLLILMGQCSFLTCHLYEYHFVNENKTWREAQTYCRDKYKDLATVSNMTDIKRLRAENKGEAWIGLNNKINAERTWHWSLPGVEFNENETQWDKDEPNDANGVALENCVVVTTNNQWIDIGCDSGGKFICYDETKQAMKFNISEAKKTWLQAQKHCREHHTDLVSGLQQLQDQEFMNLNLSNKEQFWIGLFRDTWRWSDGSRFSFRNWTQPSGGGKCAVTTSNGRWMKEDCNQSKPFFCYEDNVILINQNKTWEEALYYCRENHNDLVSVTNLDEQRWVQERAKMADTSHVWLGLRYTCTLGFWFWISDETVKYKNWDSPGQTDECDMSGAMASGGQHKWFKKIDHNEFNFICSTC